MGLPSGHKSYTLSDDMDVEEHLHRIVCGLRDRLIEEIHPLAIVLSGSLGRGEGTAYQSNGQVIIVSDFEVGCVDSNWFKRRRCRALEPVLAEEYGIDLTLNFFLPRRFTVGVPANWTLVREDQPTIDQYELMKATRFLYGPDLRVRGPEVSGDSIPLWEGIRLLFNRMAELIEALLWWEQGQDKALVKACTKLLIASGDALLLMAKRYEYSYRERMNSFREITDAPNPLCPELVSAIRATILRAYEYKLYAQRADGVSIGDLVSEALTGSESIFRCVVHEDMGIQYSTYDVFCAQYLQHPRLKQYSKGHPMVQNMVSLARNGADPRPFSFRDFARSVPIMHRVYAELPLWLYGSFKPLWDRYAFDSLKRVCMRTQGRKLVNHWYSFCG